MRNLRAVNYQERVRYDQPMKTHDLIGMSILIGRFEKMEDK